MAWCLIKHRDNFKFLPFTNEGDEDVSSIPHKGKTKLSLYLTKHHVIKTYGAVEL